MVGQHVRVILLAHDTEHLFTYMQLVRMQENINITVIQTFSNKMMVGW